MTRDERLRREEEAAEDYAWSIRNWPNRSWPDYNALLIEEHGMAGFMRIKRRAWQLLQQPGAVR